MRFITFLRQLDNQKKDTVILVGSAALTTMIVLGGVLFTQSSFYAKAEKKSVSTSTIDLLKEDLKATILPTVKDIQKGVGTVSEEYEKKSFENFFVPKSE